MQQIFKQGCLYVGFVLFDVRAFLVMRVLRLAKATLLNVAAVFIVQI
ncbi:hypothetical protein W04_1466 [Pseudoalteromonas sp. SW0106-04]|nr:hypothetical protein W04_1466 [Pseudoalteromonas sp. SW0106-04]